MTANRFFLALSFFFIIGHSFGQSDAEPIIWKTLLTESGIKVEYRKGSCDEPKLATYTEVVYLRFTNTTSKNVSVDWKYDVTYGTQCFNCDGTNEEMNQTLRLDANSSVEGVCGDKNDLRLRIFSRFTNMDNVSTLTDFHVKDLRVREINQ